MPSRQSWNEWENPHNSVIPYLRRLLDKQPSRMTTEQKESCKARFLETVRREEEFFDKAAASELSGAQHPSRMTTAEKEFL
jgi:thiaminase